MKQHKFTYLIIILMLFSVVTHAQEPQSMLKFQSMIHNFGHIKEDGGEQLCRFFAINEGNNSIEVTKIETSCGCTSAQYTKGDIAPNEKFEVAVRFNPFNRPGRIDKHIYIIVSDSEAPIRLTIEGFVQERERTIDELYPFDMGGGLRLRSNYHAFGYIEHGSTMEEHIGYVNTSDRAITLAIENTTPSELLDITYPTIIPAGEKGDITLHYAVSLESDTYGTKRDIMRLMVDGTPSYYTLTAQVIVVDNFDIMDDISAPMLVISKNIIKFGEVNCANSLLEQRVVLTNEGASTLIVRTIESSSSAVECPTQRDITIAPGASHEVVVRLHTSRIEDVDNPFSARVYIISNDPLRPMQSVRVNALPQ